jgi:hypothetical protein
MLNALHSSRGRQSDANFSAVAECAAAGDTNQGQQRGSLR